MPSAIPGLGECTICCEMVSCVKTLDCGHALCLPCVNQLVENSKESAVVCPECRRTTQCPQGVGYLKTKYFGKIGCDVCLERKDAEDMWWCGDCVQALCSRCSITEHARKKHAISEWNKMEPVQFCVSYLDQVNFRRQLSSASAHNEQELTSFMSSVEDCMKKRLSMQPDLEELKQNLISRYGSRFSTSQESDGNGISAGLKSPTTPPTSPAAMESGSKVVAKVLQLAGAVVEETGIPKANDDSYQVRFNITPEEVARFIHSKIEFVEQPSLPQLLNIEDQDDDKEVSIKRIGEPVPVLQVDYCIQSGTIVLRTASEVHLYGVTNGNKYIMPAQKGRLVKDACFGSELGELLLVFQSTLKKYLWTLEAFQIQPLPATALYAAQFDVDPEEVIEAFHLAVTGEGNASLYEVRLCAENVSEVWRAVASRKKDRTKLKETLIFQRPNSQFNALKVVCSSSSKERFLFVWDQLSNCLYRIVVKDNRCEASTKILHSSEQIPFSLDPENRLWLFDPHLHNIFISRAAVLNRQNVLFDDVHSFTKHGFCGLWVAPKTVICLNLTATEIKIFTFEKS